MKHPHALALVVALGAAVAVFAAPEATLVHAHGGEDHGAPLAPPPPSGSASRSAETASARYELLLVWDPAAANEPTSVRAYLSDFVTNAPVERAELRLSFSGPGALELPLARTALPGRYVAAARFPALGTYAVTATVHAAAGGDLLALDGLVMGPTEATAAPAQAAPASTSGVPLLWFVLALVAAVAFSTLAFFAGTRRGRAKHIAAIALASFGLRALRAEAHGGDDHGDGATAVVATPAGAAVRLGKEAQFLLGLLTTRPSKRTMAERLRATGHVTFGPEAHAEIVAPYPGRIAPPPPSSGGALPRLGAKVQRGQILALLLETPAAVDRAQLAAERARAAGERDAARARLASARATLARQRALGSLTAPQALTEAEAAVRTAEAEMHGASLAADALAADAATGTIPIVAPIDGTISDSSLAIGGFVSANERLVSIVDLDHPWVAANLFETDLGRIDTSSWGRVSADTLPAEGFAARPIAQSPVVDPVTRTADLVYAVDDAGARLRLNQFVFVDVPVGPEAEVLALPATAIIERDGVPAVWVKTAAETFAPRPVALGRREAGLVAVRGDLVPGDRIVIAGAAFLSGAPAAAPGAH